MSVLKLPDLGEGLQEAEIVNWHVAVGDHVVTNQPLVAVETDKAVVEVPAPGSGTITRLCAAVGDIVQVGEALVEFSGAERSDSGTVVGTLKSAVQAAAPRPSPQERGRASATPAVRALARTNNIDINSVEGSGPGGAILSADIEKAASQHAAPEHGVAEQAAPELDEGSTIEALRGVRRAMAERMALAHSQVVPATVHGDADIHNWPEHADTMLRLVQAIAMACTAEPALNVWLDSQNMSRRLHHHVDLGIAVDTADGLFVPTLRDISKRDAVSLSEGIAQLKQDVEARSIPPAALRGQTITLSNFGSIGGRYAQLVVVPPQVAIVGAGRIRAEVLAIGGNTEIHRQLPLSLSFDHRVVTGAEATRFMAAMIADLEQANHTLEPHCD